MNVVKNPDIAEKTIRNTNRIAPMLYFSSGLFTFPWSTHHPSEQRLNYTNILKMASSVVCGAPLLHAIVNNLSVPYKEMDTVNPSIINHARKLI